MRLLRLHARVLGELRRERGLAFALALANLVLAATQLAEPVVFGRLVDALTSRAVARGSAATFAPLVVVWVAIGLFNIAAGVSVALHSDRLANRQRLAVLGRYFEHVLSLPLSFHAGAHSGRVANAMWSGSDAMCVLWLGLFREHLASFLALAVLLPCTMFLNVQLGLLLLALVLAFALLTSAIVRRTQGLQSEVRRIHVSMVEHAADSLGNLPVIQSFTRAEEELRAQRAIARRLLDAQMPVLSWWALVSMGTRAASTLTATAILLLGTHLVTIGEASVGDVVAFMTLSVVLIGRLDATLGFASSLFAESSKIEEFFSILDSVPSARATSEGLDLVDAKGTVEYRDVGFAYGSGRDALVDVSFRAEAGESIALVGATGSGKSTTLALLYRAYEPSRGVILVDGVDVARYSLDSLRRNIAVVFQEPMLFARTIRENLLVGKPDATDQELEDALARAQALELVASAPDGLDTLLSERGRSLSGGERQRLSIARALLKNPPILILDEATAALDARTEAKLKLALDEVMKGRTTFVIAHRLSTIRDATRILVFEAGRILESGSYDELVSKGGAFAELVRAQVGTRSGGAD